MKKITASIAFSIVVCSALPVLAGSDLQVSKQALPLSSPLMFSQNTLPVSSVNIGINNTETAKKKRSKGNSGYGFEQGTIAISAGYGWPNLGKAVVTALISDSAINTKPTGVGPIHFRGEYGVSDKMGLGVSVNYISFGATYTELPYNYSISRTSLSILARLNIHFGTTESLDPYFGVAAGYKSATWRFTSTDPAYNGESVPGFTPFGFETTIGMRYYFSENFGIYTELGIAKSVIQAGLAVKF